MKDPFLGYCAHFLEDNLGLPASSLKEEDVPSDLAEMVRAAMGGSEGSSAPEPALETRILAFLAELERTSIEKDGYFIRKARWPENASYASCLTHDVDNIEQPLGHLMETRKRFSLSDFILAVLRIRSVYDNLSYVASMETKRGYHSSFYFLSAHYNLSSVSRTARRLFGNGWDIGLHGDFGTHDSPSEMAKARSRFELGTGIKPKGLREHYLRFDYGKTWKIVEDAGFSYDTTVGNREKLGFRLGLCTPFHPPGEGWTSLATLELPLVLMDTTLWGYLKRNESQGMSDFQKLKGEVAAVGGLLTILWHQEAVRMRGGRIYPSLLDELWKDRCFVASGVEIANWWNSRSRPLVRQGNTFEMRKAPSGLCLLFKAKDQKKLTAEGGSVEMRGNEAVVRVKSDLFRLEVH